MDNKYDIKKAIAAQAVYCKKKGLPLFAPLNSRCWKCRNNIYSKKEERNDFAYGITVELAGSSLVTGCPYCHVSYCD